MKILCKGSQEKQSQTKPILFSPQHCCGVEKTKPIYSFSVLHKESQGLRAADCESEVEKTKPICRRANRRKLLYERGIWRNSGVLGAKKQSQFKAKCRASKGIWYFIPSMAGCSAALNGKTLNRPYFHHSDMIPGGRLVFEMGPKPNKQWGAEPEAAPPSVTLILAEKP